MLPLPEVADLTRYIETRLFKARPHIRNRRIPVATIAYHYRDNAMSISDLVDNFIVSEAEVLAALLYYHEHRAEIDAQEEAYQTLLDEAYKTYTKAKS